MNGLKRPGNSLRGDGRDLLFEYAVVGDNSAMDFDLSDRLRAGVDGEGFEGQGFLCGLLGGIGGGDAKGAGVDGRKVETSELVLVLVPGSLRALIGSRGLRLDMVNYWYLETVGKYCLVNYACVEFLLLV